MRPDAHTAAVTDGLRWHPDTGPMAKAIAVTVMPKVMPMPMKPIGAAAPNPSATIDAQPISTSTAVPNTSAKYF